MVTPVQLIPKSLYILLASLLLTACAAGDAQFGQQSPAGFWYGLWHGIISFISLVIHIFNDNIQVYEISNTGGWYDFGFLIGVACLWGGSKKVIYKSPKQKARDKEWDDISDKVEQKIMRKLKEWAQDEGNKGVDEDWKEIGEKIEKKLKVKLREWAEKD
ncbi:MAG: hypothetical protein HUJ30_07860 [Gammaproteobacteria bacterium]|nr:hypothetical protein [Gammaproteobacteria bacterium]